ncbi:MAG: hypothetical protein AMS17_06025 [Spirochaetes bacterium DG_61]|jgi:hypothetical protein|nr:MAG: hypothetical protein AMS17_06025 [Spirochaetes bacterium DG_61]
MEVKVSSELLIVLMMYDRAIDEEVMEMLSSLEIRYYTKWRDVVGVGRRDPHLGDDVWPGLNNVLLMVIDEEKKRRLVEMVKVLQKNFPSVGLRAFVAPVLEMV